MEVYIQNMT